MKIYLHEITDQETILNASERDSWVVQAVTQADEIGPKADPRPTQIEFRLRKVDGIVVLNGKVKSSIELICSRCANPFDYPIQNSFTSLFSQDPVMAGVGYLNEEGKASGQTHGVARHAHEFTEPGDSELAGDSNQELDIIYVAEDHIDLGEVLAEQIQFQIPFQPLCNEQCKGICPQCGADLNTHPCQCAPLNKTNPFAVLKNVKFRS